MIGQILDDIRQNFDAADDHAQQVVKVVRYTAGELSQCPHFFRLAQHFLSMLALGSLMLQLLKRRLQSNESFPQFRFGQLSLTNLMAQMLVQIGKLSHLFLQVVRHFIERVRDNPDFVAR